MKSLKRGLASDLGAGNISSKVFIRSTKSGKVQKIVREQYLRKDIPCSSKLCPTCPSTAPADANGRVPPFVLSSRPAITKSSPNGHYLMPDTNALLNGMDLFEKINIFQDVIVLQTVLEELKNRSLPLYNRLVTLTKSDEKRFYLFFNEFRAETYVRRDEGESINDRNDRAVRRAAAWYSQHLPKKKCPAIVVLTDDRENKRKAVAEGVTALSLHDYVLDLNDADRLLDMISEARLGQEARQTAGELVYPEYYSMSKMTTGITAGTLHKGVFNVSPYNYLEGTVRVPEFEKPLLVIGRESSNRSISGDIVVVEILPTDQWKAPSTKAIDQEAVNRDDNPESDDKEAVVTASERKALQDEVKKAHGSTGDSHPQPTVRVVGVMKRNWRQYVGTIDAGSSTSTTRQSAVFLVPMDKRIPKIRIRTRQANSLLGKRVLATIDSWDRDTRYPTGHYVRSLGDLETKEAETEALLLEYDVQYRPFPKTVLDCLPPEGHNWTVPTSLSDPGWEGRKDLRNLLVCSIDPPSCQDIDDALHAHPLPNGNIEVGVHIADVSHFVKPLTPMDTEASARGTTVYLVDKRIDMLPSLLGTDLCSLKSDVERFAFSTIWELRPDATIVSVQFTKSVILSRESFSYEQAQLRIDNVSAQDKLTQSMRILLALSKKLRQSRMDAGALNLSSPEVRIEAADDESSDPLSDIKTKAHLETNSLVEEFMLLANISVAERIYQSFPSSALLRRHPAPPASNFSSLAVQLKTMQNLDLDVSSSSALASSLDQCIDPAHPFFNTLIRILATRCMTSAEYFSSSSHSNSEYRHYGLASPIYTHFTSPIRRYADLVVHRQLAACIGHQQGDGGGWMDRKRLESVCSNLNIRHRNAQLAGRGSVEYYVGQALKARGKGTDVDGYVMRVFENGVVVFVPQFGVEGLVRLDDFEMKNDGSGTRESTFDNDAYKLCVFEKGKKDEGVCVQLFQQLKVRVSSEEKGGVREKGKRRVQIVVLAKST